MNTFLWGIYPYLCLLLFFTVPVLRMVYRPFAWSTEASGLFAQRLLAAASLLLHWGLLLVLLGHLAGLFGGLLASGGAIELFFWTALAGGVMVLLGSGLALYRRIAVRELRALSEPDDYLVHVFLIPIVALALFQVVVRRIFGLAYTAAPWFASLWALRPQPELMASAGAITKWHVFLALTFFAYFPFTKLVHVWTYPINYLVRPYQSMRTARYVFQRRWEYAWRSDKSWLVYGLGTVALLCVAAAVVLGRISAAYAVTEVSPAPAAGALTGRALYVSQCARCHGLTGRGDGPGARSPTFAAPPRDLTAGQYRFISTANGVASDDDLRRIVRRGLPSSGMPGFEQLSEAQLASLAAVLNDLWVNRPTPGWPIEVPPAPPVTAAVRETGARIYQTSCAMCHGVEGQGDGPAAANLPTRPANLAAGEIKAGTEPEQLYLRVAAGIPPLMPALRATLSADSIWAVVSYVEREFLRRP